MSKPVETPKVSEIEVIASGLDSPRKLSFGPDGALYVAEAGRGGTGASIPSPSVPGASVFYGATGAITRIQDGVAERVVTGLPSLALPDGSDAAGVSDIEFDADGNAYAIVGLASNPTNRDDVLKVPDFSQLIATQLTPRFATDSFENGRESKSEAVILRSLNHICDHLIITRA
jgi:glucose/arabinose dehydrogenase